MANAFQHYVRLRLLLYSFSQIYRLHEVLHLLNKNILHIYMITLNYREFYLIYDLMTFDKNVQTLKEDI